MNVGDRAVVTAPNGLHLRASPAIDGAILRTLALGTVLEVLGGILPMFSLWAASSGTPVWIEVRLTDGTEGWVDGTWLRDLGPTTSASADVPDDFLVAGITMCARHSWRWLDILAVALNESGVRNVPNHLDPIHGAAGFIQFMPRIAAGLLGLPQTPEGRQQAHDEILKMSLADQVPLAEEFYAPYARFGLDSAARFYQCTFVPATMSFGSAFSTVIAGPASMFPQVSVKLADELEQAYQQNSGFDHPAPGTNVKKGYITVGDLQTTILHAQAAQPARWTDLIVRVTTLSSSSS